MLQRVEPPTIVKQVGKRCCGLTKRRIKPRYGVVYDFAPGNVYEQHNPSTGVRSFVTVSDLTNNLQRLTIEEVHAFFATSQAVEATTRKKRNRIRYTMALLTEWE